MANLLNPPLSRRYLRHGMLLQLAAFEGVMRLGSVRHAADALCMAQPTLSGHLRKLSEALGVRLFELRGKQLVPTEAALVLQQGACEAFAVLERCDRVLAALRPVAASRANVDVGPGAASRSVPLPGLPMAMTRPAACPAGDL